MHPRLVLFKRICQKAREQSFEPHGLIARVKAVFSIILKRALIRYINARQYDFHNVSLLVKSADTAFWLFTAE